MKKEAIGIAINGREVKIAHMYRDKYRVGVDYLESGLLVTDMNAELKTKERQPQESADFGQEEDLFAAKASYANQTPLDKPSSTPGNVDILYSYLSKFAARRIKVGINISPTLVTYQDLDTDLDYNKNLFKSNLKKKIERWKLGFNALENVSVITRKDGTLCNVFCENSDPPILEILENLNSFFKNNLFISLMDSNEVSLVNLARAGYNFSDPSHITAIVQIETEFSRIVFMKGEDILTVSPIINESFNPDINNIVYSKIIYEQDNLNLPDLTNILLAGRASSTNTKSFFEKKFPEAKVGFIIAQPLAESLSTNYSREDLSTFAIPISLAWKIIDSENRSFLKTNLLPTQFIDRQKLLTLSLAGFLMLVLLGLTTFIMTWQITVKKIELSRLRRQTVSVQEQINSSESTVNRVHEIEAEIARLKKHIILSDSLSAGYNQLYQFLDQLNQSVMAINSVGVDELINTPTGVLIKGTALKRGDVPQLSEQLGGAKILKLIRNTNGQGFAFEMEANWAKISRPQIMSDPTQKRKDSFRINQIVLNEPPSTPSRLRFGDSSMINNVIAIKEQASKDTELAAPGRSIPSTSPTESGKEKRQAITASNGSADLNRQRSSLTTNWNQVEHQETSNPPVAVAKEDQVGFADTEAGTVMAGTRYTIKISAHANQFTANKEVESLQARGIETYVTVLPSSSRLIPYWVCFGDFSSYEEAQQQLEQLNRKLPGHHAIVPLIEGDDNKRSWKPVVQQALSTNHAQARSVTKAIQREELVPTSELSEAQPFSRQPQTGKFAIRISAHVTLFTANKEVDFFRAHGYQTYITRLPNSSPDIPYWVCLGNFDSYVEANNFMKKLNKRMPRNYDVIQLK